MYALISTLPQRPEGSAIRNSCLFSDSYPSPTLVNLTDPVGCTVYSFICFYLLEPPVNPTQPPQSGPGVNTTHTCFHAFFVLLVHSLCFYEWWLSNMGSGHWHPPMNPRDADPQPWYPRKSLVSFPTLMARGSRTPGGRAAGLSAFGRLTGLVSCNDPRSYPSGATISSSQP